MSSGLTFVVPAYNASATLTDTIRSVLGQTQRAVECVVVDDGSTDVTSDIARTFRDSRVRLVRQRNAGLAAARNAGFQEVSTDLVCFLDADDTVSPEYAQRMADAIGSHDLVACSWSFVGADLQDLGWTCQVLSQDHDPSRLLDVNTFAVGCVTHRTSSLRARTRESLGLVFDPSFPGIEDWDLLLRLTRAGASWAPPDSSPLFQYRLCPGSMSSDLALMHETAFALQQRYTEQNECSNAPARRSRNLIIRSLARAVAHRQTNLAGRWSGELGHISDRDLRVLAGALRIAFGRADSTRPESLSYEQCRDRLQLLELDAARQEQVLAMVASAGAQHAAKCIAAIEPSRRIVVAGMGRNGRTLIDALCQHEQLHRVAWLDDAPAAVGPNECSRIELKQLTKADVVVVTPDDPRDLAIRANARGVAMVIPLSRLAQDGMPASETSSP